MPLVRLYLSYTDVSDLSPLKGAPLDELNIIGTEVSDLSPLEGSRLRMLWLSECPVTDITPLAKLPLESVTLAKTEVSDLSPLKGHPTLRRLHIAETEVTELTPIKWLKLTRLIFTPSRIEKGIGFARDMETLREIGPSFDQRMPPSQFWRMYEAGAFRKE
jgi:Leucine-rich repeat (LRR) protein